MSDIQVFPDAAALARAAAERIVSLATEAIGARGQFSIGLSGGSTPRALYTLLSSDEVGPRIDWEHVHVFWGDERCVPPDHGESNYRMAREALLDHVPLPESHVHRIRGEIDPARAAADYEQVLHAFFRQPVGRADLPQPRFDLLLLGLGDDGHTASLFPGSAALREQSRWVVENQVERLGTWRITLTSAAINAAATVVFLISGKDKAATLSVVLKGPRQPEKYPSQSIQPTLGDLIWMADAAAAAQLDPADYVQFH
jgi:6-phosphogluconolactonase